MKKNIFLWSIIIFLFSSCIDNSSDLGTTKISRIKFKTEFNKDGYREDRWNEFALQCPEIIQENDEKPLSYRWDINYKTVSTEKDLRFICNELTPADKKSFNCRLTVSNEDGSSWLDFQLTVTSPYEEGVLIMSKVADGSMLSFKREDKKDQEFQLNAYKLNNPDYPLGVSPKAMVQLNEYLYFGTENPMRLVKVNCKTLEAINLLDYPAEHLDFMATPGGGSSTIYCFDNGRELELDGSQDDFMNAFQQEVDYAYPGIELANNSIRFGYNFLTYNNTDGMLFRQANERPNGPEELFTPQFSGKKLIDFVSCKDYTEALVIVQAPGKAPDIVYLDPTTPAHHSTVPTTATGITDKSVFVASQQYSRLYYSVGNEVFVYDYSTDGNFPAKSSFKVGQSTDIIKAMVLTSDDSKLYVAWESASGGELKGCANCFILLGDDQPWEKKGIAGEIVQMIYKL